MAGFGFIGMGISSVQGRGISKSSSCNYLAKPKKENKPKGKRNIAYKLTFEEVTLIRQLDSNGVARRKIFADHVEGKMTFESMVGILNYITRVWQ